METSPMISAKVGWAWIVWATSLAVKPFSMARVA